MQTSSLPAQMITANTDLANMTAIMARRTKGDVVTREIRGVSHGVVWAAVLSMSIVQHKYMEGGAEMTRYDAIYRATFKDTYGVLAGLDSICVAHASIKNGETREEFVAWCHARFDQFEHYANKTASNMIASTVTLCHSCLLTVGEWAESSLSGAARAMVDQELKRRFVRMAKGQKVGWTQKAFIASLRARRPALT